MDLKDLIINRRSIRKYLQKPLIWDDVVHIIDSGRLSPSSGNVQDWKFIVVLNKAKREEISEACAQDWMVQAPVFIIVCSDIDKVKRLYGVRGAQLYSIQNSAIALTQMMLTAESLNLGSCWVGNYDEVRLKDILKIPANVRPQAILTLGYPDETPPPPSKYGLEDVVFFEAYGVRVRSIFEFMGWKGQRNKELVSKAKSKLKEKFLNLIKK